MNQTNYKNCEHNGRNTRINVFTGKPKKLTQYLQYTKETVIEQRIEERGILTILDEYSKLQFERQIQIWDLFNSNIEISPKGFTCIIEFIVSVFSGSPVNIKKRIL